MNGLDQQTIRSSILNLLKLDHTSNADENRVGSETSDVSYVKVLEHLTANNHKVVPLGGDEKTQSASFDAIPFVAALTLERIINRASNRSRHRETAVVQKPPQRRTIKSLHANQLGIFTRFSQIAGRATPSGEPSCGLQVRALPPEAIGHRPLRFL